MSGGEDVPFGTPQENLRRHREFLECHKTIAPQQEIAIVDLLAQQNSTVDRISMGLQTLELTEDESKKEEALQRMREIHEHTCKIIQENEERRRELEAIHTLQREGAQAMKQAAMDLARAR